MIKRKQIDYFDIFSNILKVKDDLVGFGVWSRLMRLCQEFPVKVVREGEKANTPRCDLTSGLNM